MSYSLATFPVHETFVFCSATLSLGISLLKSYDLKKTALVVAAVTISTYALPKLAALYGLRITIGFCAGIVYGAFSLKNHSSTTEKVAKIVGGVLVGTTLGYLAGTMNTHLYHWIFGVAQASQY